MARAALSISLISSQTWVGCAAMECHGEHGDRLPGRKTNTGLPSLEEGHDVERVTVVRTMSAVVKLTQENDESCVSVVSAASRLRNAPLCVLPREGWLQDASSDPRQGGAEDTKERVLAMMVYGMLSLMTLWLRLIQACERVRLLRLPREACFDEFQ